MEEQPCSNSKNQQPPEHKPEVKVVTTTRQQEESAKGASQASKQSTPSRYRIAIVKWLLWRAGRRRNYPDRAKFTDIVMVLATCVMALATIGICRLALLQWRDSAKLNDAATNAAIAADKFKDTAAQIGIYIKQAQSNMQIMADSSTESLRLDERAWVNIQLIPVQWEEKKTLQFKVILTNTGRTPAKHFSGYVFVEKVLIGHKPHFGFVGNRISAAVLFPNFPINDWGFQSVTPGSNPATKKLVKMSHSDIQELNDGKAFVAVHGIINYLDVFDVPHWLRFCAYAATNDTRPLTAIQKSATSCVEYNEIDKNQ